MCTENKSAVAAPPATTTKDGAWVSPFTPERVDPRVSKMTKKEINDQFPTKSEVRAVIPPHCFNRSLFWGFYYVFRDIFFGAIVVYVTHSCLSTDPPEGGFFGNPLAWIAWRLAWNVYAVVMTTVMGGLWVIGHECGHGAFSDYPVVNDTVGWILHSFMGVPYFCWAFTHAKHHRRTNDLVDGETHVPTTHDDVGLMKKESKDGKIEYERVSSKGVASKQAGLKEFLSNPTYAFSLIHEHCGDEGFAGLLMWAHLFLGFQLYVLGIHSVGHNGNDGKPIEKGTFPDHFRPWSRMFPAKMYWKVVASDIGLALLVAGLAYCTMLFGARAVWFWYGGPYLLINVSLVMITWLQHSDPTVPHFDAENWTWMKGALAGTIDRPLTSKLNFTHSIATTHVVHHLFHEIPHYHAEEATKHVRAFLEPKGLYNYDPTPYVLALWKTAMNCHFVDSFKDGVQYYRKFQDVPLAKDTAKAAEVKKTE